MKALVIDDAPDIRIYVRALLEKWGYDASDASNGVDGLEHIDRADIRLVICDWMMPGLSGLDLCRAIREAELGHYVYVILLTGRSDKADLIEGLSAGADDFLSKPFDAQVLRARLKVAERILALEQRLADQNRELLDSRNRLEHAYNQIQADLAAAARIQRQMLPISDLAVSPLRSEWLFLPAAHISGDSFNFFELSEELIGFYHLDVSGHGIPAALLCASLGRSLVPGGGPGVSALTDFLEPAQFLSDLNRQLCTSEGEVENYATLAYGTLEKHSGLARIALAGHPLPMIARNSGKIEQLEHGGLPVGMFPEVGYRAQTVQLDPGDQLILYSDGVTDCANNAEEAFGEERLRAVIAANFGKPAVRLRDALVEQLRHWHGPLDFEDDVSVLILQRPYASSEAGIASARQGEER